MAPQDIIDHIDRLNRNTLYARPDHAHLDHEQVLYLMNAAALQGFRFGSDAAMSLVKSKLVIKYLSETPPHDSA